MLVCLCVVASEKKKSGYSTGTGDVWGLVMVGRGRKRQPSLLHEREKEKRKKKESYKTDAVLTA